MGDSAGMTKRTAWYLRSHLPSGLPDSYALATTGAPSISARSRTNVTLSADDVAASK